MRCMLMTEQGNALSKRTLPCYIRRYRWIASELSFLKYLDKFHFFCKMFIFVLISIYGSILVFYKMLIMDSWNIFGESIADTEISTIKLLCKWCKLLIRYRVCFSGYKRFDFILDFILECTCVKATHTEIIITLNYR